MFSTWKDSAAVRNASRDPRSSVLIDRAERPFAGVHYTGTAEVVADDVAAEQYGEWFKRYIGDYEQAVESYKFLVSLGIGERAFIRFRPERTITWDMSKIPGG
jgi:general stress protein 26